MVEGAPLLREYTGNGIEGSNPFFSATIPNSPYPLRSAASSERLFPTISRRILLIVVRRSWRQFAMIACAFLMLRGAGLHSVQNHLCTAFRESLR